MKTSTIKREDRLTQSTDAGEFFVTFCASGGIGRVRGAVHGTAITGVAWADEGLEKLKILFFPS